MDRVSKATRSRIMSSIRSNNNRTTEQALAALMRSAGIAGWRRQGKGLPGTPDFVFPRLKVAVFVDGCFWHGCPRCYREPKTNAEFWSEKIGRNVLRDRRASRQLRKLGWSALRVREHSLKKSPESVVRRLKARLT